MENIFVEFLPPWVETGLQPAFYDKESGTVLQQTARMYARVNMLIRMFNKLSKQTKNEIENFETEINETVEEYIGKFNELHDYVYYYFDNLDVQEEINNKLDQMAADGELEEIISLYINHEVEYIFPKFWANEYSQDCSIIKGYDKTIAIDSGSASNWDNILLMFHHNHVSHLDYFILSHYDSDHVGNVNNLIAENIIDSDTVVYLPVVPDRYPSVQSTETILKSTLTASNITYSTPTEGQVLEINADFDITFGNLNKAYMEDNYANYNYTSMVCLIRHKNTLTFYAGDAGLPTYQYLYDINFITRKVDLYKQAHHGIDLNTYPEFVKQIKPDFVVQEAGVKDFGRGIFQCGETSLLTAIGCNYYPTYMSNDYVRFVSTGYSMFNKYGFEGAYSCREQNLNLYVDANASSLEIQNGTQAHPFEDLNQAFGYIYNYPTSNVTIHLADGTYNLETSETDTLSSLNSCTVIINGNSEDDTAVVLKSVLIKNMSVEFNHVTFNDTTNPIMRIEHAHCSLGNCNITPSSTVSRGIVITRGSTLFVDNTTFNNTTTCISGYECSSVAYGANNNFGNCTTIEENNKGLIGNKYEYDLPYTNNDNGYTTRVHLNNYSQLKVYVQKSGSGGDAHQEVVTILNPTNGTNYSGSLCEYWGGAGQFRVTFFELRLRNNNTIYVDAENVIGIKNGEYPTVASATGSIVITKIVAIS